MNITFVIQGLTTGGAEKNLVLLANAAKIAGHIVTIITLDDNAQGSRFKLEPGVTVSPLGLSSKNKGILGKCITLLRIPYALRKRILSSKAHVVVAFMDQANLLTIWSLRRSKIPVVACERTNPERGSLMEHFSSKSMKDIVRSMRNMLYAKAARLVVQTERAKGTLPTKLHAKVSVVPNPIFPPEKVPPQVGRKEIILGVGRLSKEKRFDLLLAAFKKISQEFPTWLLQIAGEGPLQKELQKRCADLGIEKRVHFLGALTSLDEIYSSASVFVLCSDYEGFPTALAEAMAHGVAVIATDCTFGPRELITNQIDGILVPCNDSAAISTALRGLIMDREYLERMGNNARQVTDRLAPSKVFARWLEVIGDAASSAIH